MLSRGRRASANTLVFCYFDFTFARKKNFYAKKFAQVKKK